MQAGKLRHRIIIETPDKSRDPQTGAVINGWKTLTTVWASVEPLSVREFISAKSEQGELTARIMIRYRDDVTRKCRIKFRGKIYNIAGILPDPISGREYLTLPCSEGVNDG